MGPKHKMGALSLMIVFLISRNIFSAPTVELKKRTVTFKACNLCHLKKNKRFVPASRKLEREHAHISSQHGGQVLSCNHCHDINRHNFLRSTQEAPATFENPSFVCKRCHIEAYKNWEHNIHGRRSGGWNLDQIQYHCMDCHEAHSVTFKKMKALPPPQKPHD
ncbi:MAG: hypothetical protein HY390_07365 [Deltaproteobacteria bacterium]|nr:hypothetical protein [Deltaproteobacteria bacterium]